jgi:hypothetical protein
MLILGVKIDRLRDSILNHPKNKKLQRSISGAFYYGAEGQNRTADTGIFSSKF